MIEKHMKAIIAELGENTNREGLRETPARYTKAMKFFTSGYDMDPKKVVGRGLFKAESKEMVIVRDIELYSLCEHHLLPFFGKAHVAYIPDKKIIGLSKIPRIVDVFARRLQVQERLTTQVSEALMELIQPLGVAVIIECHHLCMMMRGVEKQNSKTITSSVQGEFKKNPATRAELMKLLRG